jgi:hypothetical protein
MAKGADLFAPLSCLDDDQTHHEKAQMHINPCTPLMHDLHAHVSFLFGRLSPFPFFRRYHPRRRLLLFSIFFVLSPASFADEATGSGSSRHPSTVSKARFYTVYRWSSFSGMVPLRVYSFSCAVVRLRRMMFLLTTLRGHTPWCVCGA